MKTYLVYKNQIQGFKDVSETVKTIEKIAASSVHFLRQEVVNLNLYTTEIEKVLGRLSMFYQEKEHHLLQKKSTGVKALVILTGDKGLVGGLWHMIINVFLENIKQYRSVIIVGLKGENYLKEENMQTVKSFTSNLFNQSNRITSQNQKYSSVIEKDIAKQKWAGFAQISDIPRKEEVEYITDYIFDEFKKDTFSGVDILYPQFVSLAEQKPLFIQFLPFEFRPTKDKEGKGKIFENALGLPIFEPSKKRIFNQLLQKYIKVFFHKIVMETKLSELSARTVAMEHAAVKTEELIQKLTLLCFKERRRIITQKQLESFVVHRII